MTKFKYLKTGEVLTVDQLRIEYKTEVVPDALLGNIFTTFPSWVVFMMHNNIIKKIK